MTSNADITSGSSLLTCCINRRRHHRILRYLAWKNRYVLVCPSSADKRIRRAQFLGRRGPVLRQETEIRVLSNTKKRGGNEIRVPPSPVRRRPHAHSFLGQIRDEERVGRRSTIVISQLL